MSGVSLCYSTPHNPSNVEFVQSLRKDIESGRETLESIATELELDEGVLYAKLSEVGTNFVTPWSSSTFSSSLAEVFDSTKKDHAVLSGSGSDAHGEITGGKKQQKQPEDLLQQTNNNATAAAELFAKLAAEDAETAQHGGTLRTTADPPPQRKTMLGAIDLGYRIPLEDKKVMKDWLEAMRTLQKKIYTARKDELKNGRNYCVGADSKAMEDSVGGDDDEDTAGQDQFDGSSLPLKHFILEQKPHENIVIRPPARHPCVTTTIGYVKCQMVGNNFESGPAVGKIQRRTSERGNRVCSWLCGPTSCGRVGPRIIFVCSKEGAPRRRGRKAIDGAAKPTRSSGVDGVLRVFFPSFVDEVSDVCDGVEPHPSAGGTPRRRRNSA